MILIICVGTDLAPAVALAYEMEENETMKLPPRSMDSHLVGLRLMLVSYTYLGLVQTFFAFWGFFWVFYDYGFTIQQLTGAGLGYRDKWVDMTSDTRNFFSNLCHNNSYYQINSVIALGKNCEQDFKDYMVDILAIAQSVYLMSAVWCQIICVLVRKTSSESILTWKRFINNSFLFWSIIIEVVVLILVVYVPGLNHALLLGYVPPIYASTSLWSIPAILLLEELRKFIIRRFPDGCMEKLTKF